MGIVGIVGGVWGSDITPVLRIIAWRKSGTGERPPLLIRRLTVLDWNPVCKPLKCTQW